MGEQFSDLFDGDRASDFAEVLRRYSARGVLATAPISGLSDSQLFAVELDQGVRLPAEYERFLRFMGLEAGGLFGAEVILFPDILGIKSRARDMVAEFGIDVDLSDALVFASHQGYMYFYMNPEDGVGNPPIFCVAESQSIPDFTANSFTEFIYDFSLS
ncbi:SMI1/KNR4 family protein [Streptomyces sp. NPDC021020]|uniref:SMI1/KNR4 family protein n=1 Tax=Streptomyces sp. NPDC021020 TaxID=3365109 RepID=UPI00379C2002